MCKFAHHCVDRFEKFSKGKILESSNFAFPDLIGISKYWWKTTPSVHIILVNKQYMARCRVGKFSCLSQDFHANNISQRFKQMFTFILQYINIFFLNEINGIEQEH